MSEKYMMLLQFIVSRREAGTYVYFNIRAPKDAILIGQGTEESRKTFLDLVCIRAV